MDEYGFNYSREEIQDLFNMFDKDRSGNIDFEEFLEKLRVCIYFFVFSRFDLEIY